MQDKPKSVKEAELIGYLKQGNALVIGEFRTSKCDEITFREDGGKRRQAVVIRHTVECGESTVSVSEFAPDEFKAADFKPPYKKGDRVVVFLAGYVVDKGNVTVRGVMAALA